MYIRDSLWSFNTRDLMRASSCEHCTKLSVARSLGLADVLERLKPYEDALEEARLAGEDKTLAQKYGVIFEALLVSELLASVPAGVVERPAVDGDLNQTIDLMKAGVPVIYQGGLKRVYNGTIFSGKPDFLVRQDWELAFVEGRLIVQKKQGDHPTGNKYTAWDAKYGGNAKPAYLLQVGLYVDALDDLGFKAEGYRHGLVLGSRTIDSFEEIEIVPAMRLAREKIVNIVSETKSSEFLQELNAKNLSWHCPAKSNCEICEYPELCIDDRALTDDLVQVANITQMQIAKLLGNGISTMKALANASDDQRPFRMTEDTYNKIRMQAKAQVESRESDSPVCHLMADPMIQYLPPKSDLDIFFDFEGFPYYTERGGLEYLFGNYVWGEGKNEGKPLDSLFTEFWAHDRQQEKLAFANFMEWALDRMRKDPNAHIYHYASYENSALKRLAMRHGIFEDEVAWLIKNGRLVDMYYIVKNSLIVGEESYSIKKLERHYNFQRSAEVTKASASIDEYDRWRELQNLVQNPDLDSAERQKIQAEADQVYRELRLYNLEDVWSTRELYRWLASMPGACSKYGQSESDDSDEEEGHQSLSRSELQLIELQAQTKALFDKVENWPWGKDLEADYRAQIWLALTHSILFYKREEVMFWADVSMRVSMDEEALSEDRTAASVSDVIEISREVKTSREGEERLVITYEGWLPDNDLFTPEKGMRVAVAYRGAGNQQNRDYGSVVEFESGKVTFQRTISKKSDIYLPNAIVDITNYPTTAKQRELQTLAEEIASQWGSPIEQAPVGFAIMDLLMRRNPRLKNGKSLAQADVGNYLPAVIESVASLDNSVLAIQGPPGSGKTYLASRTIAKLIADGKRVGVTANSHSAIENVLEACVEAGVDPSLIIKVQKEGEVRPWESRKDTAPVATWLRNQTGEFLVAGTSFFFSNERIREHHLDYLFIDEAAQYSLVDCMAVSGIADNLVLMGDPLQLPQVVTAVHPGGVENSALGHYMGEFSILPPQMGYFIEVTRRLHPDINHAVSWLAYEGKLRSHPDNVKHNILGHDTGLITVPVPHHSNSTSSTEEARVVIELVKSLHGAEDPSNVLVVAAYNAQVDLIRAELDAHGLMEVMVGTVDKFQGREGLAVIYSFAASSSMDAPRGLEFLLDRNRLNVAISRAKATCYLVFSETLLQSSFRTVAEVKAISRLAGLLEIAAK